MKRTRPGLVRSFVFSFGERYTTMVVQAVSVFVLARLIAPAAYGIFAAASAVLLLVTMPISTGLHDSLVARPRFTRHDVGAGTAAALALGVAGAIIIAIAGLTMGALGTTGIGPSRLVYASLVPVPILQAMSIAGLANLARHMRFGVLMWIKAIKAVIGALAAIAMALAGWGALSLSAGMLVEALVTTVAILYLLPHSLRPNFALITAPLRWATPWSTINFARQGADSLILLVIGATLGAGALGIFNRAQVVVNLFSTLLAEAVGPVLLPYLTRENRSGNSLRHAYDLKLRIMSVLAWPFFALIVLMASDVVAVLLGPNWGRAVPIVRILALSGITIPLGNLLFRFAMAMGMVERLFWRHMANQVVKLTLALVGVRFGLAWVALALPLSEVARSIQLLPPMMRQLGETFGHVVRAFAPSAAITLGTLALPVLLVWSGVMDAASPIVRLLIVAALALPVWALLMLAARHPLARIAIALAWPRRASAAPVAGPAR